MTDGQDMQANRRRLQFAVVLTAGFMLVEVAGGLLSGSLALLADAGHMLTDSMALVLAAFAFRVSARPADAKRSFGYHRFQIIAAFVNGLTLLAIVAWIILEAVQRFMAPPAVTGDLMLAVASAGLLVNIVVFLVLHGGDQENLNIRGAALHVLGDLLGSIATIVAAVVILTTGWLPIDPLLSIVVACLIMRSAWLLVKRSGHILLEGTPEWLDIEQMQRALTARVPQICGVHHVHVWGLTPQYLMLTMHIVIDRGHQDTTMVVRRVKAMLSDEFGIGHSTIEVETGECADGETPGRAD